MHNAMIVFIYASKEQRRVIISLLMGAHKHDILLRFYWNILILQGKNILIQRVQLI